MLTAVRETLCNKNDSNFHTENSRIVPDLFFNDRLEKYCNGPISKYTLPKKSTDEVKLEETKCRLLPPLYPYKPKLFFLPEENITVQRVVGYREIYAKRLRIQYLKSNESEESSEKIGDTYCNYIHSHLNYSAEVAPGGGEGKKLPPPSAKKTGNKKLDNPAGKTAGKAAVKTAGKTAEKTVRKTARKTVGKTVGKKGPAGKQPNKKQVKVITQSDDIKRKAELMSKGRIEKDLDYFRLNEKKIKNVAAAIKTLPGPKILKKKSMKPPYKRTHEYIAGREKDREWLSLSDSTDDGVIDSLTKPHMDWMKKRLAHESQLLQKHLSCFTKSAKYFGRAIYFLKPNTSTRQIEFLVSKKKQVYFAFTTLFIWIPLCLMVQAIIDIRFGTAEKDKYLKLEQVMLVKYSALLQAVMVNISLVGLWSIVVILQDSLVISHYLNCWNLALNEMETSGVSSLKKYTCLNLMLFLLYAILMSTCFYYQWPDSVRGTCLLIAMLICRGVVPELAADDHHKLHYEIFGLVFYLYCVYCARILFMLIQNVAIIIKNSAEMWNLKFGLLFSQFLIKNRGEMVHVELNLSIVKTFTHHRLICGLVNMFGEAFAWPIITYIIFQMTVFTSAIVAGARLVIRDKYHLNSTITIHLTTNRHNNTAFPPYQVFMPKGDEVFTVNMVVLHMFIDFMFTTEIVAAAGQSFIDGYEFVRRQGTVLCKSSHQRRMIQSLEWSMSAANPNNLSIRGYFSVDRAMIFSAIAVCFGFFSLIIQLQDLVISKAIILSKVCPPGSSKRDGYCVYYENI